MIPGAPAEPIPFRVLLDEGERLRIGGCPRPAQLWAGAAARSHAGEHRRYGVAGGNIRALQRESGGWRAGEQHRRLIRAVIDSRRG